MTAYYKAVRPNGRDFYTNTVDYGAALLSGEPVMAPHWDRRMGAAGDVALALVVRDLITPQQYQMLVGPWESVMGVIA